MTDPVRSVSPQAPDDLIGEFATASAADVAAAIAAARTGQQQWWAAGAAARSAALTAIADALQSRRDEAVALVVREVGKPLTEAEGEIARATAILRYYAQACFSAVGQQFPPSLAGLLYTERRPHGVAGLITPWNFPLAIPLWKAAPALACGNAVVLKPSPDAPACAALLSELAGAHLPAGVLSVVNGGPEAGEALVDGADVVSFTGSDRVGRAVAARAGARGVAAQCEMGGQNAAIVLGDADPQHTARTIAGAAMGYAGQKCTATRRVILAGEHPAFLDALTEAVRTITPGGPEQRGTTVGPVISAPARDRVLDAVSEARAANGRVLAGGEPIERDGWFVAPTVIDGLPADHRVTTEETFGPLVTILHARDVPEAVALARSVRFGLVTSVHGRDLDRILAAIELIDTGLIKVNAPTTGVDFYAPFGGEKDSSYGPREQGPAALDFYATTRTVTIAPHGD